MGKAFTDQLAGKTGNQLFPVFLKLENLRLLIVGGGNVGLEKLTAVLENAPSTTIRLVALKIKDDILKLAASYPNIIIEERAFQNNDCDDQDIVIIAVNDQAASEAIRKVAKEKGKLVNVADKPDLCDFYLSSIVRKGDLKIAISTNGKSPTVAKRIKEVLNEALPAELDEVLDHIHKIREQLKGDFTYKVKKLKSITSVLVEKPARKRRSHGKG